MKNEKLRMQNDAAEIVTMPEKIQERALRFACAVVRLHEELVERRGSGRGLARQVLRSGTSIGANLQEADVAQSKADFISKCSIALKEAKETQHWLRILRNTTAIDPEDLAPMIDESNQIVAILVTIVKKARLNNPS